MSLSVIVAASRNGVIGRNDDLPWRLSSDLKRFKALTMGHHMIMGRKTYDSINRLLPGRTTIILSRNPDYRVPGALMADNLQQAVELAGNDPECFVVGGAEIYRQALPIAQRIYLTRVEAEVEGDTCLPPVNWDSFQQVKAERVHADERNEYDTTFQVYERLAEMKVD